MKYPGTFFRLIRWPNLIVIGLTQAMFYLIFFRRFFEAPHYDNPAIQLRPTLFILLLLSSLFIASAGYIINDYMDQEIDKINKPGQLIIGIQLHPQAALVLYITISLAGLLLSGYISYVLQNPYIILLNFAACILLFVYSATFKKKALTGNIIISALTAWTIMVLPVAELNSPDGEAWDHLLSYSLIYSGFAFILTLIREIIKDMEDVKGDEAIGCRTIPIRWGMITAKYWVSVLIIILMMSVIFLSTYILLNNRSFAGLYGLIFVALPLSYILMKLVKASDKVDYHRLSTRVKLTMLAGIFSMCFFLI